MGLLSCLGFDFFGKGWSHSRVSEYGTKRPGKFAGMLDIVHFDSHMLRIFSFLNPRVGSSSHCLSLTVSFTPGLLSSVWGALETYLFPGDGSNEWS